MKRIKPEYLLVYVVTSSDDKEKATNLGILETHLRSNHESYTTKITCLKTPAECIV